MRLKFENCTVSSPQSIPAKGGKRQIMRSNWFFLMDMDGASPLLPSADPVISNSLAPHLFSVVASFVEKSTHDVVPGSLALCETFNWVSKFAGALIVWCSGSSNVNMRGSLLDNDTCGPGRYTSLRQVKNLTSCKRTLVGFNFSWWCKGKSRVRRASSFLVRHHFRLPGKLQSLPMLSLAAALVPPFDNINSNLLAIPLENAELNMHGCFNQRCSEIERGCSKIFFPDFRWGENVIEPRTGIEFPTFLSSKLPGKNRSHSSSEVLVGTGSKIMTIIKIKSLRVYAFGFYINPSSMCEKLGPKYASIPAANLKKCKNFYDDLLREDVDMTIRLVVNFNGMKVNTVRDAFEKSLRARLVKANPETDYKCLNTFGSCFTQDIAFPLGTIIDIRRTADGQLITERAFFDMYIGDSPVSEHTKEQIGENVANIIGKCL
ncbi:hypothetical protein V2J09_010837 [Rumex salicifolius]